MNNLSNKTCAYCGELIGSEPSPVIMLDGFSGEPNGEVMHRNCFIDDGGEFYNGNYFEDED